MLRRGKAVQRRAGVEERPVSDPVPTQEATRNTARRSDSYWYSTWVSAVVNGGLALALFVLLLPVIILVAIVVFLSDGRPIIYSGKRYGKNRRVFRIHKFRTLIKGAEGQLGSDLVSTAPSRAGLTIRFGKFLRSTRLDELPQLWNIICNEMSFIGPRPERPDVYDANCAAIENYDLRFSVKPGLIGVSQVLTPHCTEKRYRTWIDNRVIRSNPTYSQKLGLLLYAGVRLILSLIEHVHHIVVDQWIRQKLLRSYQQRRANRRFEAGHTCVFFGDAQRYPVRDLCENALLVVCEDQLGPEFPSVFTLRIELSAKHEYPRIRKAICLGEFFTARQSNGIYENVIRFKPTTPKSEYLVQKYLLKESIV